MKQSLQLKLSQHLTLTPQLQQSIKLLQMSTLELDQEIERILIENPLLEREDIDGGGERTRETDHRADSLDSRSHEASERSDDGASAFDGEIERAPEGERQDPVDFDDGDWSSAGGSGSSGQHDDDDDRDFQDVQAASTSLREHLDQQLALTQLSDRDRALVRFLVEALEDNGYLQQSLDELFELLPPELGYELDDLQIALAHLQSLEPTGVGARSPQECLALQLRVLPESDTRALALRIVTDHLELLAERNFTRLKRVLDCENDDLRDAHALICSLDPHPGSAYAAADTRYIVPDVVVRKVRGRWVAQLNADAMPRLRVNQLYASILQQQRGSNLAGELQEARWLIKNIQQRFDTILRVSQAIVDQQRQFFDYGDVAMRPLTLRTIAEELELHESTISRVTTQKFMSTPRGIFELKYFFGSHVATDTGGAASSTAICALIRQIVDAEDRKKPLSDAKIADVLGQQGIVVARRTVAKYRESLGIMTVSQRKEL